MKVEHALPGGPSTLQRLITAGLLTAAVDGAFSGFLSALVYDSTVMRLFQRVASTLLGPSAFDGGAKTTAVGVLMHIGVAFTWSAVFLVLYEMSAAIRRFTMTSRGVIGVAAVYGPMIWLAMSLVVIPLLTRTAPVITARWFVQLVGHFPFVGLPIVWGVTRGGVPQKESLIPATIS